MALTGGREGWGWFVFLVNSRSWWGSGKRQRHQWCEGRSEEGKEGCQDLIVFCVHSSDDVERGREEMMSKVGGKGERKKEPS